MLTFGELVQEIKGSISEWKRINKTPKGTEAMLSENLGLLKFLEKMGEHGLTLASSM